MTPIPPLNDYTLRYRAIQTNLSQYPCPVERWTTWDESICSLDRVRVWRVHAAVSQCNDSQYFPVLSVTVCIPQRLSINNK